jgi:hypothetical protein
MQSIRNFALAIAAGSLLAAGAVTAEEANPADKPRTEKHERMGEHGCPGMQQGRGEHDHS